MKRRAKIPGDTESRILIASRRRCCLCVFLHDDDSVHKGQIAHLNQNPGDSRFANLVWLCFNHHDEYDGRTSQAKGLTELEVRAYRDRLYARYKGSEQSSQATFAPVLSGECDEEESIRSQYSELRRDPENRLDYISDPWRFPLWQVGNRPEFFAYKSGNRCDGVCLIERINLPDGRIVIAAIQTAGNPGCSITNCIEELCLQICERFAIPWDCLVWLEHYDFEDDWRMVTFARGESGAPFSHPIWKDMDIEAWKSLGLRPRKRLERDHSEYESKLDKLFAWPYEAL